ncbi:AAA family ATPase [Nonomuraea indica]|uniref:AAA family ATPase n=1 Tax=Nonomuraea indica TaxID=1581193 RepID=A0ABW8A9M8_9ACTN
MTDLTERDDALARLESVLAGCRAGRGSLVSIRGFAGSGKTALLREWAARARAAGFLTLGALGSRAENMLPMGLLGQLFPAPAGPDGDLLGPLPALMDEALSLTWTLPVLGSPAQSRLLRRLWSAIARLAGRRPILITVDDAHHGDAASLQSLLYVARRVERTRVVIALAEPARPRRLLEAIDIELLGHPHGHRVELSALTRDGVASLLRRHVADAGDGLVAACWELTGGNPALVRAFAEDVRTARATGRDAPGDRPGNRPGDRPGDRSGDRSGDRAGRRDPCDDRFGDRDGDRPRADAYAGAVLACLHRGRPTGLWAGRAVAVLDEDGPDHLHRLLGIDPASAGQALDELDRIGVLRAGRFRDQEARRAVLGDMDPRERAAMHRRAAKLLRDHGGSRTAIARHLVAALHAPDPWVVPLLQEAAAQALLDDEAEFAVDCLNLAVRACADDAQRAETTLMLARAGWRLNPATADRHLTMLAAALREGSLPWREAGDVVRALLWHGRLHEAGQTLASLADQAGESGLTATREWLSNVCPSLLAGLPPAEPAPDASSPATASPGPADPATADSDLIGPAGAGSRLDGGVGVGSGSVGRAVAGSGPAGRAGAGSGLVASAVVAPGRVVSVAARGEAVAEAERVLRGARLDDETLPAVEAALLALMCSDAADRAAVWCDRAIEEAARRRAPTWRALLTALRAEIAVRQGRLPLAKRHASWAISRLPPRSWGVAVGMPVATLVQAATGMGSYDLAAHHLGQPVPEALFLTRFGLHYLDARGHYHLATGRPHAALDDFLACGELMSRWGTDLPVFPRWRLGAAEAQLRIGRRDRGLELLEEQLREPAAASARVRGTALRLRAALGDPAERVPLLTEALTLLEGCGDRLGTARVLADLGHAHQALGGRARARQARRRALRLATECRAEPLRRALALSEVSRDGDVTPYPPETVYETSPLLSDAEHRVASLAAAGYLNREIAESLGVTVSTVEQHLTRIYRKLDVNGRAGLAERLHSRTPRA